jgi:hypothetical protein
MAMAAAALSSLTLAGCGGEIDGGPRGGGAAATVPTKAKTSAPTLCTRLMPRISGRITTPAATELSGLVLSRTQRGVLWTHNDSGDRPRVLAVAASGRLLADVTVAGAQNVDWEDIAAGRGMLLLGDIGDNLAQRPSIIVYRVAEPHAGGGATVTSTRPASRIELRYPDGPRDAEALLRDPSSGALVIVEKSYRGAGVYVAPRPAAGAPVTLRRSGRLRLGVGQPVTGGDVSRDGRTIALRTSDRAFVWRRRGGESVAAALRRPPCRARVELLGEGQGEALALSHDGRSFDTVPEGPRPAIRHYRPIG